MRNTNENDLSDRRNAAADAKSALLQSYRAAKAAAESTREARQMEQRAVAEARDARRALREQAELDEQTRIEAGKRENEAAIAAAERREADARDLAEKNRTARVDDEAVRKAERDRRYANRKSRKA